MTPAQSLTYARSHQSQFLADLLEFLRFPSVSAQPQHAPDVKRCASWLADHLRRVGLDDVAIIPTAGSPIVYAQWTQLPDRPTVLIYGHYDVQPADDADTWRSPPFDPTVHRGAVYARGASDDKGQMFTHVKALQAHLEAKRSLPVNVKCIFEGEEEVGSTHLASFLERNQEALRSDVALMSDTQMLADRPAIVYALRGALNLELEVQGPSRELHSGLFGGAIHNPIEALSEMIARLHTLDGRVAIPHFYDQVRLWSEKERVDMAHSGPSDEQILREAGGAFRWGERNYSLYERTTIRPTLTVNGISGGYHGPGTKAVIPSHATAKLSFRLVPDQDPLEIERQFRRYIADITPSTIRSIVRTNSYAQPVLTDRRHRAMRAAALAYARGFGEMPVYVRSGGTIPVVGLLQEKFGIPTVLMGFASPNDQRHGSDEKLNLDSYYKGIEVSIWFFSIIGKNLGVKADFPYESSESKLSQ